MKVEWTESIEIYSNLGEVYFEVFFKNATDREVEKLNALGKTRKGKDKEVFLTITGGDNEDRQRRLKEAHGMADLVSSRHYTTIR